VVGARSGIRFDSMDEKLLTVGIGTGALFDGAETADATLRFLRGLFLSGGLIPTAARNSVKLVISSFSSRRRSGAACTSPLKPKYTVPS
jgi:DNA-binding transcriptional regulator WhiA